MPKLRKDSLLDIGIPGDSYTAVNIAFNIYALYFFDPFSRISMKN